MLLQRRTTKQFWLTLFQCDSGSDGDVNLCFRWKLQHLRFAITTQCSPITGFENRSREWRTRWKTHLKLTENAASNHRFRLPETQKPSSTDYVCRKLQNLLTPISFAKNRKTPPFVIPEGCEVFNCKEKSKGSKFVRGPNLLAWNLLCRKTKEKGGTESSDQVLEEKDSHWSWINVMKKTSTVKRGFLIIKHMTHWRIKIRIRLSFICS